MSKRDEVLARHGHTQGGARDGDAACTQATVGTMAASEKQTHLSGLPGPRDESSPPQAEVTQVGDGHTGNVPPATEPEGESLPPGRQPARWGSPRSITVRQGSLQPHGTQCLTAPILLL